MWLFCTVMLAIANFFQCWTIFQWTGSVLSFHVLQFVGQWYVLQLRSSQCVPSAECGNAHEWLCGLADSRHSKGHQPPNAQGEDPHGGALHEGGAG